MHLELQELSLRCRRQQLVRWRVKELLEMDIWLWLLPFQINFKRGMMQSTKMKTVLSLNIWTVSEKTGEHMWIMS